MTTKSQITGVAYIILYDELVTAIRERLADDSLRGNFLWQTLKRNESYYNELFGCRPDTPANHFQKKFEQVHGSIPISIDKALFCSALKFTGKYKAPPDNYHKEKKFLAWSELFLREHFKESSDEYQYCLALLKGEVKFKKDKGRLSVKKLEDATPQTTKTANHTVAANETIDTNATHRSHKTPSAKFNSYKIGNVTIPVMSLVSFIKQPCKPSDVIAHFKNEHFENQEDYPSELKEAKSALLSDAFKKGVLNEKTYKDNKLYRLDSISQEAEDEHDNRGKLILHFSLTRYSNIVAINSSLDIPILKDNTKTIREEYSYTPYRDLSQSILANAPGVEVVVLSHNEKQEPKTQVIIRTRSNDTTFYHGHYQVSASGYMNQSHIDEFGRPSLFVTAAREAGQELADDLILKPEDFKLLGIGLTWSGLCPNFIGYYETDMPADEIVGGHSRDGHEGDKEAIPFTVESVISHLAKNHWTAMSAFAMISTLLAKFPAKEVRTAAQNISINNATKRFA